MGIKRVALVVAFGSFLLTSYAYAEDGPNWQPTLDAARKTAAQSNRLVLIYFHADWCKACRAMDRDTLNQAAVMSNLQSNYVAVKINADFLPKTAQQYGVTGLPTTVVTTADGQMVDKLVGPVEAQQFVGRLNQVVMAARRPGSPMLAQVAGGIAPPIQSSAAPVLPQNQPYVAAAAPSLPSPLGTGVPQNPTGSPAAPTDRYADYFSAASPPAADSRIADPRMVDPRVAPIGTPPYMAPMANNPPPLAAPVAAPSNYAMQPSVPTNVTGVAMPAPPVATVTAPPAADATNPPLGLDGYCPVQLMEQQRWVLGDRRWGLVHRGRTYLFTGPVERDRFNAAPDAYAPVMAGNDVVLAVEQGQNVPGHREHGVFCGKRVYLFADEASLKRFEQNPATYANQALQAMRSSAVPMGQSYR